MLYDMIHKSEKILNIKNAVSIENYIKEMREYGTSYSMFT